MRVGVYGGSFNPAHEGHAHVARTAMRALHLDKVLWLVSPQNPLKGRADTAPLAQRLAGARALAGPGMVVSDLETRAGLTFTADTLAWLKRRYPGVRFFWIMGADSLVHLHRWRRWRALPGLVEIAVAPRPGFGARARLAPGGRLLAAQGGSHFLEGPLNDASSTMLRNRAKARS